MEKVFKTLRRPNCLRHIACTQMSVHIKPIYICIYTFIVYEYAANEAFTKNLSTLLMYSLTMNVSEFCILC